MEFYEKKQYFTDYDFPRVEHPSRVLILACTPRCGSNMLGYAMQATGSLGFPLEYGNPDHLNFWKQRLGTATFDETLRELQSLRTSPNGIFSIKIHHMQLRPFGGFKGLRKWFPDAAYILLSRDDALKQAVSLALAHQTGKWMADTAAKGEPRYDFGTIDFCLRATLRENASWRYFFASQGIPFLDLRYEAVQKDLRGSVREVARHMRIEIPEDALPLQPLTEKQSSPLNDEWEQRFVAERRNRELFPKHLAGRVANFAKKFRLGLR